MVTCLGWAGVAHQAGDREEPPVQELRALGQGVGGRGGQQVGAARVAGRKEPEQQRHGRERIELDERIEAQVASSALLGNVPVPDGDDGQRDERTQEPEGRTHADPVADGGVEQSHHGDGERQAIPRQPRVAGRPVVVGGPESGQQEAAEDDHVGPALTGIPKRLTDVASQDEAETEAADQHERGIGQHVERVGDPQEGARIGQMVVGRILRDWWREERPSRGHHRQSSDQPDRGPPFHGPDYTLPGYA
jgi:hypothetical protein